VITLSSFEIPLQNCIAGTGCNVSTATILSGHARASVSTEQISRVGSAVRSVATVPGPIAGMMLGSPAVAQIDAGTATQQEPQDRGSDIYPATFEERPNCPADIRALGPSQAWDLRLRQWRCSADDLSSRNHQLETASHDYLVIASGLIQKLRSDAATTPSPRKTRA
jgi:hypothetical protein